MREKSSQSNNLRFVQRVIAVEGQPDGKGGTVPHGRVWVEGDNKNNSTDSREYGPIPEALIVGKVVMRIWPLTRFAFHTKRFLSH